MPTEHLIGLRQIYHALPSRTVASEEVACRHEFDTTFIRDKLGIAARHVADGNETSVSLAVDAGRRVLERTGTSPSAVDLLVLVTQTPDYLLPHGSAMIQAELGLPASLLAFDISLGCSGFVYGLATAEALMVQHGLGVGLVITSETYSRLMAEDDRSTAPLFGDGAAAALLTTDPVYRFGRFTFGTDGTRHEALIARGSGCRPGNREPLFMDGRAIFSFMMSEVPKDVARCLEVNDLTVGDVDRWVFHQASAYMLRALSGRLEIDAERLVIDLEDVGNTTSSTIPIALERKVLGAESLPPTVFISGFGVGLSWASTVLIQHQP